MSHTVEVDIELNDMTALAVACRKLGLEMKEGSHKLYSTTEAGVAISLEGWKYPVVIRKDGTVAMDNYNGRWGKIEKFNGLKQRYGIERAAREARIKGYSVLEKTHSNGDIKLKMTVGG